MKLFDEWCDICGERFNFGISNCYIEHEVVGFERGRFIRKPVVYVECPHCNTGTPTTVSTEIILRRKEEMAKYVYGNKDFPILMESHEIRVYKNSSDEVFIEEKETGIVLRFSAGNGLAFTTDSGVSLEPRMVGAKLGWGVKK